MARSETGTLSVNPEPTEVRALVDEAGASFLSGDAKHPLRVELGEDLPLVMADRGGSSRCSATCFPTPPATPRRGRPSWSAPSVMACMWRCPWPTRAGAYRRSCCRSCSASSPGVSRRTRHRRPAWTGQGWGWTSARASWRPTGAASGPRATAPAWDPGSPSRCLWREGWTQPLRLPSPAAPGAGAGCGY